MASATQRKKATMPFSPAPFTPTPYTPPDFTLPHLAAAPDVTLVPAPKDFVAPEGYHAMSIYPEYLKIAGQWTLARDSRMDCVAVVEGGNVFVREFRHIRAGDLIACGRTENGEEGILVYTDGFRGLATSEDGAPHPGGHDNFAFRLGRSRETAFSRDYDELYELLRHDRDHGSIVWVMGPAFTFNGYSREAFAKIIDAGYADAVFAGNALATHDLEGAYFHTSLGQDIDTQENRPNGHYHHLDTINRVRYWGSIERFIEEEGVHDGIMNALVRNGVPYVLAGSIRDDGPLPGVYGNAYEAQDAMRDHIRSATTVICMATMLHTIATGNMTPSYRVLADGTIRPVYFYCVDIAEFAVNKLVDRSPAAASSPTSRTSSPISPKDWGFWVRRLRNIDSPPRKKIRARRRFSFRPGRRLAPGAAFPSLSLIARLIEWRCPKGRDLLSRRELWKRSTTTPPTSPRVSVDAASSKLPLPPRWPRRPVPPWPGALHPRSWPLQAPAAMPSAKPSKQPPPLSSP